MQSDMSSVSTHVIKSTVMLTQLFGSDINSKGGVIEEDRQSGADAEHRQGMTTINHSGQKYLRAVLKATTSFGKKICRGRGDKKDDTQHLDEE